MKDSQLSRTSDLTWSFAENLLKLFVLLFLLFGKLFPSKGFETPDSCRDLLSKSREDADHSSLNLGVFEVHNTHRSMAG